MKRVFTALILIPVVLLLIFLGPRWQWIFTIAVAAVAALSAWEFTGLARKSGANIPRIAVLAAILALFAASLMWEQRDQAPAFLCLLSLALLLYCTFFTPVEQMVAAASTAIFCLFYIGFTLTTVLDLRDQSNGPSLLTFLFCVVWAGDISALYIGRAFGRHKMAPSLSPNKTWEGTLGSVAGSLLAAGALLALARLFEQWDKAWLSYPEDIGYWLLLAVLVNAAAQAGDLTESALKRSAGVKDSGTLIPGHGGLLDRIDALLLAAPVLWYAQRIHQWF
ncbi:MAG: phosphatidate cytidylyltransferase [Terracidiphilus sp.]|jgi:phosphatidate cytidylyltransferase